MAGSPGMVKAEQWGMIVMKESGAENAWMQQCMVPHWVSSCVWLAAVSLSLFSFNVSTAPNMVEMGVRSSCESELSKVL